MVTLVASGGPARAQVQHEFVPDVDPGEALRTLRQLGQEPDAIVHQGELLSAPDLSGAAEAPPMLAAPGPDRGAGQPGQRAPEFRPDRLTQLEKGLDYYAGFNPTIAPFKRVTSLDAIRLGDDGRTPILTTSSSRRTEVPVLGTDDTGAETDSGRDRFWGQADVDFREGAVAPLPSVSPEARMLTLRAEPARALRVERDAAGNFYVVAEAGERAGFVRLSFLTDADASFFGMPIPAAPVTVLADRVPPVPDSVRRRGLMFARELGLSRKSDLHTAIHRLVAHFRSFEESDEPPQGEDIYLALARSKKGICRHRAYGFVVTAQALGIPARFVQNEAHSFVEVLVADRGPLRIDLGGAPAGLTPHGTDDRPHYRPRRPDDLPRPPAYEAAYAAASRHGGRAPEVGAEAAGADQTGQWLPAASDIAAAVASNQGPAVASNQETAAAPNQGPAAAPGQGPGRGTTAGDPARAEVQGPGSAAAATPARGAPAPAERRVPLFIDLDERALSARRGRTLAISGRVRRLDGKPPPVLRIEVSLASPERDERMLLGVSVTDPAGRFAARLSLPADLPAGDYDLVVLTPGDAKHQAAVAN